MVDDHRPRRLAVILAADVVGYSRLVGIDEEGTLAALRDHRSALDELVVAHHGRIFGTAGDSFIAEFSSAVEAVRAAVDIQQLMASRNLGIPPEKRLTFRIGINLGDVVVEKSDLLGDGVNIAARLEANASPGGICISGAVFDQVQAKLALPYRFAGEQRFKNISQPVRTYRVEMGASERLPRKFPSWMARRHLILGAIVLLIGAGAAGFLTYRDTGVRQEAGLGQQAEDLSRHNKATVLVLPLRNMTGDPELDGFAAGLTEEVVTAISRHPEVFVIAGTTAAAPQGNSQTILDLARANNVQYVLQGTINKLGDQIRVTAQLIDGASGGQLRPETQDVYGADRDTVRNDARGVIVAGLFGQTGAFVKAEERRANRKPETERTAYDLTYLALEQLTTFRMGPTKRAIDLLEHAIQLEPNYGFAHANLAWAYLLIANGRWGVSYIEDLKRAYRYASRAAAIDGTDYWPPWLLGAIAKERGDLDEAWRYYQRALEMNPDAAELHSNASETLVCLGRYDEALMHAELGLRLLKVPSAWMYFNAAWAAYHAGDYQLSFDRLRQYSSTGSMSYNTLLAVDYAQLGRDAEAEKIRAIAGGYAIGSMRSYWESCFKDNPTGLDHWLKGLSKAGYK